MAGASAQKDYGNPVFNNPGIVAMIVTVLLLGGFVSMVVGSASSHGDHGGGTPAAAPAKH